MKTIKKTIESFKPGLVQSEQAVATQRKMELVKNVRSEEDFQYCTLDDEGFMKMIRKAQKKINHLYYMATRFRNNDNSCSGPIILFAARIKIIKGKLDMPDGDTDYLAKSRLIRSSLILNAGGFFGTPFPDLAAWDAQNDLFEQAIEDVGLHVLGAEGDKGTVRADLKVFLDDAAIYVNKIARRNQPMAVAIITSASMTVIVPGTRDIPELKITNGLDTGTMIAKSKAVKIDGKRVRANYEFRYSLDEQATWVYPPSSPTSKTILTGFTVNGRRVWFSKRTISTKGGISDWCAAVEGTPR